MISETKFWLDDDYQLKDGSYLGIVSFSSGYTLVSPLTQVKGESVRNDMKAKVGNLEAGGGTEIGNALIYSAQVRESEDF